jgi:hypothetical protein
MEKRRVDSHRPERSIHHALIFGAGALAMLGALFAVARVSGEERTAPPSVAEAEVRAQAYAASAERYCLEMIPADAVLRERCVRDQVNAAHEIYRIALPMRDDDPRRRILSSCERALGVDVHLRLDCYQERLGALQLNAGWMPRRETERR